MARLMIFLSISVALMFIFTFFGFQTSGTTLLQSMGLIDNPSNFIEDTWYLNISDLTLLLSAAGAVIIGFIISGNADIGIRAAFATYLLVFVSDIVSIITYTQAKYPYAGDTGFVSYIVTFILGVFVIILSFSIFDWIGGND